MIRVDYVIVYQGKINVVNGNLDFTGSGGRILPGVYNVGI